MTKSPNMVNEPIKLPFNNRISNSSFVQEFTFDCGNTVPVYEVTTANALTQLIGHAMFINESYGDVYYRGIDKLYDNVRPSLLRSRTNGVPNDLIKVLETVCSHPFLKESLKLLQIDNSLECRMTRNEQKRINRYNRYIVESMMQHYIGLTRFIDLVDNHWVALWMGMHRFESFGKNKLHCKAIERALDSGFLYNRIIDSNYPEPYVFILLLAFPHMRQANERGISENHDFVIIDLRKSLPSIFLRPHAQHAVVARKRDSSVGTSGPEHYDLASQVVGIIKVRLDYAKEMIGSGTLLTQENLFPSPGYDQGYNSLLINDELFQNYFRIKRYF